MAWPYGLCHVSATKSPTMEQRKSRIGLLLFGCSIGFSIGFCLAWCTPTKLWTMLFLNSSRRERDNINVSLHESDPVVHPRVCCWHWIVRRASVKESLRFLQWGCAAGNTSGNDERLGHLIGRRIHVWLQVLTYSPVQAIQARRLTNLTRSPNQRRLFALEPGRTAVCKMWRHGSATMGLFR